jgi:hypothetical protein
MTIMSDIIYPSSSSSLSQNNTPGYSYSAAEAAFAASVVSAASLLDDVKDCPYAFEVIHFSSTYLNLFRFISAAPVTNISLKIFIKLATW